MKTEVDEAVWATAVRATFTTNPDDLVPELKVRADAEIAAVAGVTDMSRVASGFRKALSYYSSAQRPNAFLSLLPVVTKHLSDEQRGLVFWQAIYHAWPVFDRIPHTEFGRLFRGYRRAWRPEVMDEHDRSLYDALPYSGVEIWRGQDVRQAISLSWTLDRALAIQFAKGLRFHNREPLVIAAEVRRSNVAMIIDDRTESEVVLFRRPDRLMRWTDHRPTTTWKEDEAV